MLDALLQAAGAVALRARHDSAVVVAAAGAGDAAGGDAGAAPLHATQVQCAGVPVSALAEALLLARHPLRPGTHYHIKIW